MDSKLTVNTSELNVMRQFENDMVVFSFLLLLFSDDSLSEIGKVCSSRKEITDHLSGSQNLLFYLTY